MRFQLRRHRYEYFWLPVGLVGTFVLTIWQYGLSSWLLVFVPAFCLGYYAIYLAIERFNNKLVLQDSGLEFNRGPDRSRELYLRKGEDAFIWKKVVVNYLDILAVRVGADGWVEVDVDPAMVPEDFRTIAIPAKDPGLFANELELRVERAKREAVV